MEEMMNQKEAKCGQVMDWLKAGKINRKKAGKILAVSVRQIKRILRRYRTEGMPGLIGKKCGRVLNQWLDEALRSHGCRADQRTLPRLRPDAGLREAGQATRHTFALWIFVFHNHSPHAEV